MSYRYVSAILHGVLGILVGGKVCFILPPVICCCYLDKKKFPSPSNIREFIVFSNVYNNRSNSKSEEKKGSDFFFHRASLTSQMWFNVICTLIDNDMGLQNVEDSRGAQQILTTVIACNDAYRCR